MKVLLMVCGMLTAAGAADLPDTWQTFLFVDTALAHIDILQQVPALVAAEGGSTVHAVPLAPDSNGFINLRKAAGGFHYKSCAWLLAEIHAAEPETLKTGTSADWWMEWRVNGERVLSTLRYGNNRYYNGYGRNRLLDYVIGLPLKKGRNQIAVKVLAGSGAWFVYIGNDEEVRQAACTPYKRLADYRDDPLEYPHLESTVPDYTLPELLVSEKGKKITTVRDWEKIRRPEILRDFETAVHGAIPRKYDRIVFTRARSDTMLFDGKTIRREIDISVTNAGKTVTIPVSLFFPATASGPVPVFVFNYGRSFRKKHPGPGYGYIPVYAINGRGMAVAVYNRSALSPDNKENYLNGILRLYPGLTEKPDGWRTIGAWAYGTSRVIDYLETLQEIDKDRIAAIGHSRGGKTSLWAAANDTRIALACVNNSGCLGAALSRRKMGERIPRTVQGNPHWFNANYAQVTDENDLPVDQHMLIALVAPRAVSVSSSLGDPEADPKGEYLSLMHADPVYSLYGKKPLETLGRPKLDEPLLGDGRTYHIKDANHSLTPFDWNVFMRAMENISVPPADTGKE